MDNFKKYIILWLSQSVSQLGSSMTAFALVLWAYAQSHSALSVSVMSFCEYVPYIIVSIFVGNFIDTHKKKTVMLVSDSVAAVGSLAMLLLFATNHLVVWNIYIINIVIGVTTAFQQPASAVAVGRLVPKDKISNVSGMNSFSNNLIVVFSPMLAAALFAMGGLSVVLLIDMASFLKMERGILYIMLTMAMINFFSRLTYENILSPMILSRSANNSIVLGIVNGCMGIGGIVGGIIVSVKKESRHKASAIYISAALSFLFGDLLMAVGRNAFWWSVAAIAASIWIPFIMANQNTILYKRVPDNMQGRVFAVRNAIQYSTIPIGILLGGYLADYVFEPFMRSDSDMAELLQRIVGEGAGTGMAVMFLCTGILGFIVSMMSCFNQEIRKLNDTVH